MPKRPRQHQLEEESRRAFESVLPPRIVYRQQTPDYGIDGEVEEFDAEGSATGRRFFVQLKATGETNLKKALRVHLKHETVSYFRAQANPVLMVRYVSSSKSLFARWFHAFDPCSEHVGDSGITFRWTEADVLDTPRIESLLREASRIHDIKSLAVELPLALAVSVSDIPAHGYTRSEIVLSVEAALMRCPGVLGLVENQNDAYIVATVSADAVGASVAGLASVTLHLEDGYEPDVDIGQIVSDLMSSVAFALARAGQGRLAAQIAEPFFADSLLVGVPEFSVELANAMLEAGQVGQVLSISEQLDKRDEEAHVVAGFVCVIAALQQSDSFQDGEHEALNKTLSSRLQRRLETGDQKSAAGSAENLGHHFRKMGRHVEAAEHFEQAANLDPDRLTQELAVEIAGSNFLGHRFDEAAHAYDVALDRFEGSDPHLEARRADALMSAGRYRDALESFSRIEGNSDELDAWIYCKVIALETVLAAGELDHQRRDTKSSELLAGQMETSDPEDLDAIAAQIWSHDAASPLGWFNWAHVLLERGLVREAKQAYLVTAVMQEGDVEAWVNVGILAIQDEDPHLLEASAITGHRLNRPGYLIEFSRQLRDQIEEPDEREEFIRGFKQRLDEALDSSVAPAEVVIDEKDQ